MTGGLRQPPLHSCIEYLCTTLWARLRKFGSHAVTQLNNLILQSLCLTTDGHMGCRVARGRMLKICTQKSNRKTEWLETNHLFYNGPFKTLLVIFLVKRIELESFNFLQDCVGLSSQRVQFHFKRAWITSTTIMLGKLWRVPRLLVSLRATWKLLINRDSGVHFPSSQIPIFSL